MRSFKAGCATRCMGITDTAFRVFVFYTVLVLMFLSTTTFGQQESTAVQDQITSPTARVKITSPAASDYKIDQKVSVTGTATIPVKNHLWLVVNQIKKSTKKPVYLNKVKLNTGTNSWKHKITLIKLDGELDRETVTVEVNGQQITKTEDIKLEILAIVVDAAQHEKLDTYLTKKLTSGNSILAPFSAVAKDMVTIQVK